MLDFLREEGVSERIIEDISHYRSFYKLSDEVSHRVPSPRYRYYGKTVWEMAATALLSGEHLLLAGPKATGKNLLAQCLSSAFGRPEWDISFYVNIDAAALIGADTFENGKVALRSGPVTRCAQEGGFGVLDEINMAKNEALAVLHAALDFRRMIDVPGYDRIPLHQATRFIATMNYGYAGTRELNEALASRFMVIDMPVISSENLKKLLKSFFPTLKPQYLEQFAELFGDIRKKCDSGEISTRALDLRGLTAAIGLVKKGLPVLPALEMGLVNKCFDGFERELVEDIIAVRLPQSLSATDVFEK